MRGLLDVNEVALPIKSTICTNCFGDVFNSATPTLAQAVLKDVCGSIKIQAEVNNDMSSTSIQVNGRQIVAFKEYTTLMFEVVTKSSFGIPFLIPFPSRKISKLSSGM